MQWIRRLCYLRLAWLDLYRLRSQTLLHVTIVAGICLPILILLGLKRGHIQELRRELVTSPTGRQVVVSIGSHGELLTAERIQELASSIQGVDIIVPDAERLVTMRAVDATDGTGDVKHITLRSSVNGDPLLKVHEADVGRKADDGLVISEKLADELSVNTGDRVRLTIQRKSGRQYEEADTDLVVTGVIPTETEQLTAYADVSVLDAIEIFVRGGRVKQLGWPPAIGSIRDRYAGYLLFTERAGGLSEEDLRSFGDRGLSAARVKDEDLATLHGQISAREGSLPTAYLITGPDSRTNPRRRLSYPPSEVTAMTADDDIAIPWNAPLIRQLDGLPVRIAGLSLPRRTWLRTYLADPAVAFSYSENGQVLRIVKDTVAEIEKPELPPETDTDIPTDEPSIYNLALDEQALVPVSTESAVQAQPSADALLPLAIVPVQMLARCDAYLNGLADYDPQTNQFIPLPPPIAYTQIRLYGNTIDDVLPIADELSARRYAYRAQTSRIREIRDQDRKFSTLVTVVGVSVFFFGLITVCTILLETTERKRGTIGILRVMGVSRPGIFTIIFLRSIAVGLLAGLVAIAFGLIAAIPLSWKPDADTPEWARSLSPETTAVIEPADAGLMLAGSVSCCLLGAVVPAWRASRRDPFNAIMEGRFR